MKRLLTSLRWQEAIPRILADFAIVQVSAIFSLVGTMLLRVHGDGQMPAATLAMLLRDYYTHVFFPLSLIFPIVFLLNGFYTKSRAYRGEYKWGYLFRGTMLATLVYLCVSYLVTRTGTLPRSALLAFGVMVACGTVGARWLKEWVVHTDATLESRRLAIEAKADAPVLIVGGAGYIGSVLVRKLLESGRKVRILDNLVYGPGAIRDIMENPRVELVAGDCRNIQSVVAAVKGVSSIVHLAAIVGDPACEQDSQAALQINYAATRMLIEIAKGNGVGRFVFASTCSVYGASDTLTDERSEVKPLSLYARTKIDSEEVLLAAESESFHPTILRLATVFGHSYRPRFDLVVNLLLARAYREGVMVIFNGQQWRPFIHVRDAARGVMQALNAPLGIVSGTIFNLGDSRLNCTLADVAEKIRVLLPATEIRRVDNADARNYRVAFDRIKNLVGFRAELSLEDGIRELKQAFDDGLIGDYADPVYHNQKFLDRLGSPANISELDSDVMAAFSRPGVGGARAGAAAAS